MALSKKDQARYEREEKRLAREHTARVRNETWKKVPRV